MTLTRYVLHGELGAFRAANKGGLGGGLGRGVTFETKVMLHPVEFLSMYFNAVLRMQGSLNTVKGSLLSARLPFL